MIKFESFLDCSASFTKYASSYFRALHLVIGSFFVIFLNTSNSSFCKLIVSSFELSPVSEADPVPNGRDTYIICNSCLFSIYYLLSSPKILTPEYIIDLDMVSLLFVPPLTLTFTALKSFFPSSIVDLLSKF